MFHWTWVAAEGRFRVFWYPESSFRAGVALIRVDDVPVKIYSPEKTISDCFKYQTKIYLDLAIEALGLFV